MKSRIAINCWILRNKNPDGIGYFTINTISRIIRDHQEIDFHILCDKKFTEDYFDFPNVVKHRIFPALRHPVLYVMYMEIVVPYILNKIKPDIMVSTDGFLSLFSSCRQLPVIHDINFEHYPRDLKLKNRIYYKFFFNKFARKAARIATVSEYSKSDIVKLYHIAPEKIDTIYSGINSHFNKLSVDAIRETRQKWTGGRPYFFFVGSMHPRKNIRRLIEAFNLFKSNTGSDFRLLLAGSILWDGSGLEDTYTNSQYKDDIIFTGRLSDEGLCNVLGAAFALSFVPVFEGFGLPILEAMQCGVPVICSNVTSMPEVAGDAALLVDPFDVQSIADGMKSICNESLRQEMIDRGFKQKGLFSWDRTAALFWDCIVKAIAADK